MLQLYVAWLPAPHTELVIALPTKLQPKMFHITRLCKSFSFCTTRGAYTLIQSGIS